MFLNNFSKQLAINTLSLKESVALMDSNNMNILFIINDRNHLIGIFTRGDYGKAILNNHNHNSKITKVMNKNFYFLNEKFSKKEVDRIFKHSLVEHIPILKNKKILKVISRDLFYKNDEISRIKIPAVIMAGGQGKRLKPFTNVLPKPLIPYNKTTIIEEIISNFQKAGIEKFFISLNSKSEIIHNYLKTKNLKKTQYVIEKEFLGTCGAIFLLKNKIKSDDFILSNCDILINSNFKDIYDYHISNRNHLTLIAVSKSFKIPYGICNLNKFKLLKNIEEKKEFNFLINSGCYIFNKKIFNLFSKKKQIDMDELINSLIKKNFKVGVYPISSGSWVDIGQWEEYFNNNIRLSLNKNSSYEL